AGFGVALVASILVVVLITRIGLTAGLLNRMESGRRRAEERMRLIFEAAPSAMVMIDEGGGIALVNTQAESLFGYPRSELLGERVSKLISEENGSEVSRANEGLSDLFTAAKNTDGIFYGWRKTGGIVPIEVNLNPIQTDEGNFVLASVTDITKRKAAQDALR